MIKYIVALLIVPLSAGILMSADQTLWGIDGDSGKLYRIDSTDASIEVVGSTGVLDLRGLAFRSTDGFLYSLTSPLVDHTMQEIHDLTWEHISEWNDQRGDDYWEGKPSGYYATSVPQYYSHVYRINPRTAAATKIGTIEVGEIVEWLGHDYKGRPTTHFETANYTAALGLTISQDGRTAVIASRLIHDNSGGGADDTLVTAHVLFDLESYTTLPYDEHPGTYGEDEYRMVDVDFRSDGKLLTLGTYMGGGLLCLSDFTPPQVAQPQFFSTIPSSVGVPSDMAISHNDTAFIATRGDSTNSLYSLNANTGEFTPSSSAPQPIGTFAPTASGNLGVTGLAAVPGAAIVFRELKDHPNLFWNGAVPGWDHVGLLHDGKVYESHPPQAGYYVDPGHPMIPLQVPDVDGVQAFHTSGTFRHYSETDISKVAEYEELWIPKRLAEDMVNSIQTKMGAPFHRLPPQGLGSRLSPELQKGKDGAFTCVGLIEWAAEQQGYFNNGEGFIPDAWEMIEVTFPGIFVPPVTKEIPTLSPGLLHYALKDPDPNPTLFDLLQGIFDPVDFLLTDPKGRQLGYNETTGLVNEIPGAYYSGDGDVEQFFISDPIPGNYTLRIFGLGDNAFASIANLSNGVGFEGHLAYGETVDLILTVDAVPEPSATFLLGIATVVLTSLRVRRRRQPNHELKN